MQWTDTSNIKTTPAWDVDSTSTIRTETDKKIGLTSR